MRGYGIFKRPAGARAGAPGKLLKGTVACTCRVGARLWYLLSAQREQGQGHPENCEKERLRAFVGWVHVCGVIQCLVGASARAANLLSEVLHANLR